VTVAVLPRRCGICREAGHRRETCRHRSTEGPPELPGAPEAEESPGGRPMCPHCDRFIDVQPGAERCPACRRAITVRSLLVASKVWR